MWCPICGAEYRPGFARCSDCDVALVDTEPEADPVDADLARDGKSLVTVFAGPPDSAEAVKELLGRRGVLGGMGPAADVDSFVDTAVVVRAEDVPRALEIIETEDWESLVIEPGDPIYDESIPVDPDDDEDADETGYATDEAGLLDYGAGVRSSSMDATAQPSPIRDVEAWYSTTAGRFVVGVVVLVVALVVLSRG